MNPKQLFSAYMQAVNTPSLSFNDDAPPELKGKTVGLINGSAWIMLWGYYYAQKHLPGVKVVSVGNEAVQLNFMKAHASGLACPPTENVELFAEYARQLIKLANVDAILITCSTMNRSMNAVNEVARPYRIPIVQIDEPMMERAVRHGGKTLVVATHGPTVHSTQLLLRETARRLHRPAPEVVVANAEDAFASLGKGDLCGHNALLAQAIRLHRERDGIEQVILAQLSMAVFSFDYPDPDSSFGVPVYNSGDEGFRRMRAVLSGCTARVNVSC